MIKDQVDVYSGSRIRFCGQGCKKRLSEFLVTCKIREDLFIGATMQMALLFIYRECRFDKLSDQAGVQPCDQFCDQSCNQVRVQACDQACDQTRVQSVIN